MNIHYIDGTHQIVQRRVRDVFPMWDKRGNPLRWFVERIPSREGVGDAKTLREAQAIVAQDKAAQPVEVK